MLVLVVPASHETFDYLLDRVRNFSPPFFHLILIVALQILIRGIALKSKQEFNVSVGNSKIECDMRDRVSDHI